jgi:DNA-binding transcriptional ArsR family regulator
MATQDQAAREEETTFVIEDVATLKALAEPLRLRLMNLLATHPRTVKELATIVGVPQTRLYYHVKILERHGLIGVTSRRMVSGIEERTYRSTASSTTVSPHLANEIAGSGVLKAFFDMIRAGIEVALEEGGDVIGEATGAVPFLSLTAIALTPDEVLEVQQRVADIMNDYRWDRPRQPDTREYDMLFAGIRQAKPDAS